MTTDTESDVVNIARHSATTEFSNKLTAYGEDVLTTKFPNVYDGLKNSTRRIVWASRRLDDYQGFSRLIGTVADLHVGGDQSIEKATIRLGQEFMIGNPLIAIQGKSGEYYDPKAYAAPRYLKAAIAPFAKYVYFTDIDERTIPMKDTKTFSGLEPAYLIPKLPMALVLGNLSVGFGFKSYVPMIDLHDVCDAVMAYATSKIEMRDITNSEIVPHLIPSFAVRNIIRNRDEILEAYRIGKFDVTIQLEGWVDMSGSEIVLRALPYGTDFGGVTDKLRESMKNRKSFLYDYIDSANQYSSSEAEFSLTVKRGVNPFEALDALRTTLSFNNTWKPLNRYLCNNRVIELPPTGVIRYWYEERFGSIAGSLKYKQSKIINQILYIKALLVICGAADEVISIIKNADDTDDARAKLMAQFPELTRLQTKMIVDSKLNILTKAEPKRLRLDLEECMTELHNIEQQFSKIDEHIYNDAQYCKKKFKSTSLTKFTDDFIGYVQFGNWGIIHFFDLESMYGLLNSKWPSHIKRSIHIYDPSKPEKFIIRRGALTKVDYLSKEITCEGIVTFDGKTDNPLSLVITDEGYTSVVERNVACTGTLTVCPITPDFYAIHADGSITVEHYQNFTIRKTVGCRATRTDIIYALQQTDTDVVIFHMNDAEPNVLCINRILCDGKRGRLVTNPSGTTHILGVYSTDTELDIFLNIPEACRKATTMEYLKVENISKLFVPNDRGYVETNFSIPLSKQKVSKNNNITIKRSHDVRTLSILTIS